MPADVSGLKARVVGLIQKGHTIPDAMDRVDRHPKTYDYWRKTDPAFKEAIDHARALLDKTREVADRVEMPPFDVFCEKYLHQPLHYHQMQWWDLLEGREPRDLHPSMTYAEGDPDRILINTPVHHAKTITLTVNYVTWRICENPSVRILMVSKTKEMAKEFLLAVKSRLTHPEYRELQLTFAPEGGWKATADVWSADKIYVGAEDRKGGEKDPTVQALGIQGHIYGARADLIILDDTIVGANAHEYEKQISWLEREVETRLTASGKMLVVGTRIASLDLYSELQNPERYTDGECPWTVLTQPAVLEFAEDPADWKTLWPAAQVPCDCRQFCNRGELEPDENNRYPKWDGPHLSKIRRAKSPATWSMVYMQQQVTDDAVFSAMAVTGAIDGQRQPGPLLAGALGHREYGMEGTYVVAGLDPAMAENTAAVVMAVDRTTKRRWVLDVFDQRQVTPQAMRELIMSWTVKFSINEWRIEKNAFQIMLTQDAQIRDFLASRGCLLREHYTGNNKWDVDFGIASMALLFGQHTRVTTDKGGLVDRVEGGLIGLPATKESESTKRLVEQLITWAPETKNKTDIVMALWFAEIRAREIANADQGSQNHLPNKYLGRRARQARSVVNLDVLLQEQQAGRANRPYVVLDDPLIVGPTK